MVEILTGKDRNKQIKFDPPIISQQFAWLLFMTLDYRQPGHKCFPKALVTNT